MKQDAPLDIRDAIWELFDTNRKVILKKIQVKSIPDQEKAVHEMRVAIKKIRTVFRLAKYFNDNAPVAKHEVSTLRTFFKSSGLLRELHVHQKVLDSYELIQVAFY